jgi:ubiquinone/menaquinone biosynthesis C-methylase UbiE
MPGRVSDAVSRYVLDGGDEDIKRLLMISELLADHARAACHRVGVEDGWRAIECGCGPLGALAALAEMVGSSGRVLGLDFSEGAVRQAKTVVETVGLRNVEVVLGDIHHLDVTTLGGPFDVAYTRQFLMHQTDPVYTLTRIADLLRPGGWLIAQEPFRTPPWRAHPAISALGAHWELLYESVERAGTPHESVEDLPRSARAAGLEVATMSGFFSVLPANIGLEIAIANMSVVRERALQMGVATDQDIEDILTSLRAAERGHYEWIRAPLVFDLAFRKPSPDPI